MHPHTDQEWEVLPHVLLTEDTDWDPTHLDHEQVMTLRGMNNRMILLC
jgi:hypothetical protein